MSNNMLRLVVSFAAVDRLSGSLKGIVGLAQSGSERLAGMKREARDLERELRDVQAEQGRALGNVTALFDREAELKAQIARTNREMAEQVRLLKVENQVGKMRARADALKSAGQSNLFGGAATLAPLAVAAKGAMDFQAGMTDIALKAALSRKETAQLQQNILNAARDARQLPENMRAGADILAGFGMTPQQAVRMIGPIGRVATAYRAEIADLAAASFANFSNLKVPISQNARALEIMASAGKSGAFEVKDMAQYFPALTAQAQAFGQHGVDAVADLAAAAQIARKGTGDAASAATNLQNLLAKINTQETIQKFAKMGVDLPAALKKAYAEGKTPLEAIAEITNRTLGGKLDRISFLFGDMQAQQALRPLIQNMDEYRRIRAQALASKGGVDADFAFRMQDAATQAQALTGNLQRIAITLGPVLLPPLVRASEFLLRVSDGIAAWAQRNPQLAGSIVGIVAGIGAFRLGLGALQLVFGGLLGPFSSVFGFLMRNGPGIVTVLGVVRTAFLFLARGVMQAGLMMLANPVVAVIVGIVAALAFAGYMVYKHWDTIKAAFWGAVAWLRGLAGTFWQLGSQLLQGLWNGISSRVAAIKSLITGIASSVVGWFRHILGIKSPSRVFMALGGHIAGGLALGIDRGQGQALGAVDRLARGVAGAGTSLPDMAPLGGRRGGGGAGSGGGRSGGRMAFGAVNITINAAAGQSAQDIAAEVERVLARHADRNAASARSAFADD